MGAPPSSLTHSLLPSSSTTSSPIPGLPSATARAASPENLTRIWPPLARSRKSRSERRSAHWRVEDEYGHSSVTTAWIVRLSGGLSEMSRSWIGIVVDMVHWRWFYLLIVRNVQDLPPAHIQNLPQVTSKSKEAKSRVARNNKPKRKARPLRLKAQGHTSLSLSESAASQPASSHLRLII